MVEAQAFIGLTEKEARSLASEAGLVVSVATAAPMVLTNSMQMNRITFVVTGGVVTSANFG